MSFYLCQQSIKSIEHSRESAVCHVLHYFLAHLLRISASSVISVADVQKPISLYIQGKRPSLVKLLRRQAMINSSLSHDAAICI